MSYWSRCFGTLALFAAMTTCPPSPHAATSANLSSEAKAPSSKATWLAAVADGRACDDFSYKDAGASAPQFSDFKTSAEKLTPVAPRITDQDRTFRTAIRRGAASGPNFAGHYTFVDWGVGTGGRCWAIADAKTGRVSIGGLKDEACLTIEGGEEQEPQFRIDSRLLILSGHVGDDRVGVAYYEWDGHALKKLRFYPWDQLCHGRVSP